MVWRQGGRGGGSRAGTGSIEDRVIDYLIFMCIYPACENAVSTAVTEAKQAEMRLKSAQAELKEKEKASKSSEQAYSKDRTIYDVARKEVDRIEVR